MAEVIRMNNEKEWHELRRKVMYSSDIDEEAKHWAEIDINLELLDAIRKNISPISFDLLVSGEFKQLEIHLKEVESKVE